MEAVMLIPIAISFVLTLLVLPRWIKKCESIGLLWEDMNKYGHPKNVASSGGIVVVVCFVFGVFSYIALRTFVFNDIGFNLEIFSLLSVILILAVIGLTDDLLGWRNGGLSVRLRLFLILFASVPLVVINAGYHIVDVPFIGIMDFGIWYPFFFIPLGIIGATSTYNFLAGFNGLESSQGIIILSFLSLVAYLMGNEWLGLIGLCMVFVLLAFYIFNKYPAKVFPGDILTYSVGALIAIMAILGNFERIAVVVFIPYILETILKLRGGLKIQSFGTPNEDGTLSLPYDKFYSLNHVAIYILQKYKTKVYEKDVVYLINLFQIVIVVVAFFLFKNSILN